jgi:hypothetical protein
MGNLDLCFAWWSAHAGKPYWRPGSPETRFGQWGYDCSGAQTCACRAGGVTVVPTSSGDAAKWALKTGRAYSCRNAHRAKPGDLVIYDRWDQPTQSNGPRGHIGQVAADGRTWESAGKSGVALHNRNNFWVWAVDMSDFFEPSTHEEEPEMDAQDKATAEATKNYIVSIAQKLDRMMGQLDKLIAKP